jgi:hypothetical protein
MGTTLSTTNFKKGDMTFKWSVSSSVADDIFNFYFQIPSAGGSYQVVAALEFGGEDHHIIGRTFNGGGGLIDEDVLNDNFVLPSTITEYVIDICDNTVVVATVADNTQIATMVNF